MNKGSGPGGDNRVSRATEGASWHHTASTPSLHTLQLFGLSTAAAAATEAVMAAVAAAGDAARGSGGMAATAVAASTEAAQRWQHRQR